MNLLPDSRYKIDRLYDSACNATYRGVCTACSMTSVHLMSVMEKLVVVIAAL